jgi:hypothetical protein
MRALGFLLLLLLPLSAGETDELARAVARFGSDSAGEREAASQAVRRYLQAELGPLLVALKSDDPEVNRRAREAIASLLPAEKQAEEEAEVSGNNPWGNMIVGIGNARGRAVQNFRFVLRGPRKGQLVVVGAADEKQTAALKKFGVEGYPVDDALVRRQLQLAEGRGFAVTKVFPGTAAARIGLQVHDVVLAIGGRPVKGTGRVLKALGKEEAWNGLEIRVVRVGRVVTLRGR